MLTRILSGDAFQLEVQKHPPCWSGRRWSLVSPWKGQSTMLPVAMSILCSPSSTGEGAQLSLGLLATSLRYFAKALQEQWDQAALGHIFQ